MSAIKTFRVCGVDIAALSPDQAAELVVEHAERRAPLEVHLCNSYTLSLVDGDARLRETLDRADVNLCDGTPLSWFGRRHGMRGPVRGPGLVGDVARLGVERGVRHYLWGGNVGVADEMAEGLTRHAPGIEIAGTDTPPFRMPTEDDLDALAEKVRKSGANIVWVGVGTPKQDYVVPRLSARLTVPVVPVGAAFDFWSGAVAEAPRVFHGSGLEWLFRLTREPRRLWRRYLMGNPRFLWSAFRHRGR